MKTLLLTVRGLLDRQRDGSPILLRVPVGAIFLLAGWMKIQHMGLFAFKPPVPLGDVLGPLVPGIELLGGLCLILGLGTRVWGFLLACVMFFAILFHWSQGFLPGRPGEGWANQAVLLAACALLVIQGAGTLSLDRLIAWRMGGSDSKGA